MLAVVRHAATGPSRRGVIFANPGGPGGEGTVQIPAWIGFWPTALLRDYDIVSWDPCYASLKMSTVATFVASM